MDDTINQRDLFRQTSIKDKLKLFQQLLEARTLTPEAALALLNTIHRDLNAYHKADRVIFRQYAEAISSLKFYLPDTLQQVVDGWKASQPQTPEEWLAETARLPTTPLDEKTDPAL